MDQSFESYHASTPINGFEYEGLGRTQPRVIDPLLPTSWFQTYSQDPYLPISFGSQGWTGSFSVESPLDSCHQLPLGYATSVHSQSDYLINHSTESDLQRSLSSTGYSMTSEYLRTPPTVLVEQLPDMHFGFASESKYDTHTPNGFSLSSPSDIHHTDVHFSEYMNDIPSTAGSENFTFGSDGPIPKAKKPSSLNTRVGSDKDQMLAFRRDILAVSAEYCTKLAYILEQTPPEVTREMMASHITPASREDTNWEILHHTLKVVQKIVASPTNLSCTPHRSPSTSDSSGHRIACPTCRGSGKTDTPATPLSNDERLPPPPKRHKIGVIPFSPIKPNPPERPTTPPKLDLKPLPTTENIYGCWADTEKFRLQHLVKVSSEFGVASSGRAVVDWDWVVREFGGTRSRRQIFIEAVKMGLRETTSNNWRKARWKSTQRAMSAMTENLTARSGREEWSD